MQVYATFWALLPPIIAIVLALITKEVYSSLFIGIVVGALFYSGFSFEGTLNHIFFEEVDDASYGMISVLSDSSNVGILIFLVILGALVALMNNAGGSAAFGSWATDPHQDPCRRTAGHHRCWACSSSWMTTSTA